VASFRSPKTQAAHAVGQRLAIGEARHGNRDDGRIHSIGTARAYTEALSTYTRWLQDERLGDLRGSGRDEAKRYLEMRSTEVSQAQLDKDRQSIQSHLGERLPVLRSEVEVIRGSRLYTPEQLAMIREHQTPRNAYATAIVEATGIRAHELLTLLRQAEQPRSGHRTWRNDLHAATDGCLYTVVGKGGLIREVVIPAVLAERLEAGRQATPQVVIDRGVRYSTPYSKVIGGGAAWSQSVTSASMRVLGRTSGGHSIRATWVNNRIEQLQAAGYGIDDAKQITTQNCGHFSVATLAYYTDRS
jgi:integrase